MKITNPTRLPECQCPHCHKAFDSAASLAGGGTPKPGNWTLCLGCAAPLRFTETLTVRALDEMERLKLESGPDWPEFQRLIELIRTGNRVLELNRVAEWHCWACKAKFTTVPAFEVDSLAGKFRYCGACSPTKSQ